MCAKGLFWVEHHRTTRAAPKHYPMPKRPTALHAPFNRKKREIRQCLPGGKRLCSIGGPNTVMTKKRADVSRIRPEPFILRRNASCFAACCTCLYVTPASMATHARPHRVGVAGSLVASRRKYDESGPLLPTEHSERSRIIVVLPERFHPSHPEHESEHR